MSEVSHLYDDLLEEGSAEPKQLCSPSEEHFEPDQRNLHGCDADLVHVFEMSY